AQVTFTVAVKSPSTSCSTRGAFLLFSSRTPLKSCTFVPGSVILSFPSFASILESPSGSTTRPKSGTCCTLSSPASAAVLQNARHAARKITLLFCWSVIYAIFVGGLLPSRARHSCPQFSLCDKRAGFVYSQSA